MTNLLTVIVLLLFVAVLYVFYHMQKKYMRSSQRVYLLVCLLVSFLGAFYS